LFFNLRKSKKRLGWLNMEEVNTVAEDLGVNPEVVLEMESRLSGQDIGFDLSADSDDDDRPYVSPSAYLVSKSEGPETELEISDMQDHQHNLLYQGLGELDERSQDIIRSRWLSDDKATLQTLADRYGVSAERIRQLEVNAMNKIRASFSA
jgi:RNA polymerase sigma-32 factor